MIETLAALLVFQTIGEVVSYSLRLPVPGPVIGMVLLLAFLRLRPRALAAWRPVSVGLLQHLSLLFVPAGVGIMAHWHRLAAEGLAIMVAIVSSALLIAWALGASPATLASLAPKSVTTPVAMGVAEKIGGIVALTAVMVVITGMVGAIMGSFIFNALGIRSYAARGFAIGLAAHGQGVARAFVVSEEAGAFAGLAMGLTALATALVAPWLAPWLLGLLR